MVLPNSNTYDALLWLSFGGPESSEDVMPFLRNVTQGRNVPEDRLAIVAEQYQLFGGKSQINQQNRELIAAVKAAMESSDTPLPIYFGNRNWAPYVCDAVSKMLDDGITNALVFVTSAYGSYSACRQYREDLFKAKQANEDKGAITLTKLRHFYNHPLFIRSIADGIRKEVSKGVSIATATSVIVATAHSIPTSMALTSDYVTQLAAVRTALSHELSKDYNSEIVIQQAYQSRSGSPSQPWLEPDISKSIRTLSTQGVKQILTVPIGFISDHQEVRYDLDTLAAATAGEVRVEFYRAKTASHSPYFVPMVMDLIAEMTHGAVPQSVDGFIPTSDCPADCCISPTP